MTVLVSDSFNRANITVLDSTDNFNGGTSKTWVKGSGSGIFGISNNQAYASTTGNDSCYYVDSGASDVTISTIIPVNSGENGIYFRYVNTSNWFRMVRSSGTIYLQKKVNGTLTTISSKAVAYTTNEKQSVVTKSDGTLQVLINDVSQITATDTLNATNTNQGIGCASSNTLARWDNFQIEDLGGGTPTGTDGTTTFDLKQSIYADSSVNVDTKLSLYSDSLTNADTKQTLYQDGSVAVDSKQILFNDSFIIFDTLQEFFSDGIVGSIPFDMKMILYSDSSTVFDSKQAWYTSGSFDLDMLQSLHEPPVSIIGVISLTGETQRTIYLQGKAESPIQLKGIHDSTIHLKGGIQ